MEKQAIRFELNGDGRTLEVAPERRLLWVLRADLGLTGTKYGCGIGSCGSCTVLVDGKPTRSCLLPTGSIDGTEVTTIEGLAGDDGELHPLQRAFVEHGGMQCGFCTPGMVMNAKGLLNDKPQPTRDEIVRGMEGNICRCGTHVRIIAAIESAAKAMSGGPK